MPKKSNIKSLKSRPAKASLRAARDRGSQSMGQYRYPVGGQTDMSYEAESHERTLIGLTDPFSAEAAAARYPDQGAGRTLTFQQKFTTGLGTDDHGNLAFAISPRANFPLLVYSTIVNGSNVVNWPATMSSAGDFSGNIVNTSGQGYRITSFGMRIANTLSATDSAGILVIAKGGPPFLGSNTTFNPSNFTDYDIHPLQHGGEWVTTSNPKVANAYSFIAPSLEANTSNFQNNWTTTYVGLFGSKISSSPIYIECYLNYEYVVLEDSPLAGLATRQPILNIGMQTAINAVQETHPTSHKGAKEVVSRFVRKEAKKALLKHVLPFVAKKATLLL